MLLLPVTMLVVLGTVQVISVRQGAAEARAESRLADAVTGPGSFLDVVIDERNHTAVYLLGAEDLISSVEPGQYLESRQRVDGALEELLDFIAGEDEQVQEIYAPALEATELLDELRSEVDTSDQPRDFQNVDAVQRLFERFAEVTDPLFDANRQVSLTVTDADLQRGTAIVDQALRQSDTIALLTYQLVVAALAGDADGINTPDEYVTTATLLRDLRAGEQAIRLNGEGTYAEYADALFASEHIGAFTELVDDALYSGAPDVGGLFANAGDDDAFGYDKLREAAEEEIQVAVDGMNGDARRTQTYFTIGGLSVLGILAIVTTLVAWSITRPLRSLTRQAMAMANQRLPGAVQGILEKPPGEDIEVPRLDPIRIQTRDEVADVARALNTVQDSALDLAVEQAALRRNIADSFVYLGRRNQSLLGRQLDFITELEQGETDPTALANLFRLDHLATRMRRNAESLLVLAGIEPPRTWRVPVPLTDVVRAALGEVEDYQRVAIRGVESASIVGSAAADLAHLLAELIENALAFSPPHQAVEIRGRYRPMLPPAMARSQPPDDDGAFTLTVVDSGVGMSEADIARANQRLMGEESFTVAPSKYLGHYVAGMIAKRHGIHVRLDGSSQRGITATVTLPAGLLATQQAGAATPAAGSWQPLPAPLAAASQHAATRGLHPGGRAAEQQDTYRVGDTEFQIDFGTSYPPPSQPATGHAYHQPAPVSGQVQAQPPIQAPPIQAPPIHAPPVQAPQAGVSQRPRTPAPPPAHRQTAEWAVPQDRWAPPQHMQPQQPQQPQPSGGPGAGADPTGEPGAPPAPGDDGQAGHARRARHVRDALSSFSAGLEKGRGAAARERDERAPGTGEDEGDPGGTGQGERGPDPGHEDQRWT